MTLLGYAVTRPIKLGKWAVAGVVLFAVLYLGIITLLNVVAVGYENVQVTLNTYNSSLFLWYQNILPSGWAPPTTVCNPAIVGVNQGCPILFQFDILILRDDNKWIIPIPVQHRQYRRCQHCRARSDDKLQKWSSWKFSHHFNSLAVLAGNRRFHAR